MHSDEIVGWDRVPSITPLPLNQSGSLRVYFLGDSFTDRKDWPSVAQSNAAKRGVQFDGYNLGVSGYGTVQELQKLERDFDEYQPELVILLLFAWNDIRDNYPYPEVFYSPARQTRPYVVVENGSGITLPSRPSWIAPLLAKSEVYLRLINRAERKFEGSVMARWPDLYARLKFRAKVYYDETAAWSPFYLAASQDSPYVRGAYDATLFALKDVRAFTEKHGASLLVIGIDDAFTVDEDVAERYLAPIAGADPDLPLRTLTNLLKKEGIPFVNAQPMLLKLHQRLQKKVYNGPIGNIAGHLEPEADALIGGIAADWIVRSISK
jgi:hypothetical protein